MYKVIYKYISKLTYFMDSKIYFVIINDNKYNILKILNLIKCYF